MIRRIRLTIAAVLVAPAATAIGSFVWLLTSLPETSGEVVIGGLTAKVEIVRDRHGIPHIFAESPSDAYFALGYVHAQDRLWQMEFLRRLGAGRLAEVMGEKAVGADRLFRTLGLYRTAEASVGSLSPDVRAVLEAYAAGVNTWLARRSGALPPEFAALELGGFLKGRILWLNPEPWRVADSLVWGRVMALRLGRNRRMELLRACIAEELESNGLPRELMSDLWPDDPPGAPVTVASAPSGAGVPLDEIWAPVPADLVSDGASNAWVVHGRLTDSGKPILANDPHLDFGAPVTWYLARIEAPGLSVTGATVPGMPFAILGHNANIAWGFTNAGGDVEDLFVETIDPQNSSRYLTPDGPREFNARMEVIRVGGGEALTMRVRETRHGPVVSGILENAACTAGAGHVVALASPTWRSDDRTVEALFAIGRARNWEDFLAAAADFHTPHQNLFYAANDGDIGFVSAGRIPIRKAGNGQEPVPGADGNHDWKGIIPFADLPRLHNPPSGRIVNANNCIVDDTYPYLITGDCAEPFRAERIVEVLDARNEHTLADNEALQRDVLSTAARRLVPLMLAVRPGDERGRRAVALLSAWDYEMRRERPEPLIYAARLRQLIRALAEDELGDVFAEFWGSRLSRRTLFVDAALTRNRHWCDDINTTTHEETCEERVALALDRALDEITAQLGPDIEAWRWGDLHRATFTNRVLTHFPVISRFADLTIESDGGDQTVNRGQTRGGDSDRPFTHKDGGGYRAVYDLADLDSSRFMIATGQSGNFLSPHYDDLLQLWRDGGYLRIAGSLEDIKATATGVLSLRPAGQ